MKVDKDLINRIASVARLSLTDKEKEEFVSQLKEVLENFSKLDEVDTKNTQPSFQPVELKNALRDDKTEKCLSQQDALRNTPHKKDGYFKGPRII